MIAAGLEDVGAVRDVQRVVDVLLDQQDRPALGLELGDGLEDPLDHQRRQAERRLVEQEQARPAHERPPDRQHLLLAARQRAAGLAQPLAEQREQLEHHLEVLGRGLLVAAATRRRGAGSRAPIGGRRSGDPRGSARCRARRSGRSPRG